MVALDEIRSSGGPFSNDERTFHSSGRSARRVRTSSAALPQLVERLARDLDDDRRAARAERARERGAADLPRDLERRAAPRRPGSDVHDVRCRSGRPRASRNQEPRRVLLGLLLADQPVVLRAAGPTSDSIASQVVAGGLAQDLLDDGHRLGRGLHALAGRPDEAHAELRAGRPAAAARCRAAAARTRPPPTRTAIATEPRPTACRGAVHPALEAPAAGIDVARAVARQEPTGERRDQQHRDDERDEQRDHDA